MAPNRSTKDRCTIVQYMDMNAPAAAKVEFRSVLGQPRFDRGLQLVIDPLAVRCRVPLQHTTRETIENGS